LMVREREILRVVGTLKGNDADQAMRLAGAEIVRWAQSKAIAPFPAAALRMEPFEQEASGRSRVAIVIEEKDSRTWALRVEDPDREMAGRIWTTELSLLSRRNQATSFTVRQLVGSPEISLEEVEPHVPGIVRQIIKRPGLMSGGFQLADYPLPIKSEAGADLLLRALIEPSRTLPIIVLTVPSSSADEYAPLLNATILSQACAGLAIVVVIPSRYTWKLTQEFGRQLSVYEGAVRIYQKGFSIDANPFSGHDLILPDRFTTPEGSARTMKRLRWSAALGSVTGLVLGTDLPTFGLLRLRSLEQRQDTLRKAGATDTEQLEAATLRIAALEKEVRETESYIQQFSDLHSQAEDRACSAETQLRAAGFRIQQLIGQIHQAGNAPDENIVLPNSWDTNLAGRVALTPQARRAVKDAIFEDVYLAARCLLWLANDLHAAKTSGTEGSLRDRTIEPGVINAHCGNDAFQIEWQGKRYEVEWHIKNRGNTRNPQRCLRIYYFWDEPSQQSIIAHMPAHVVTDAS
jgi:hypothetical protein